MSFGIYVHIPYCIQRCPYCDFATYELGTTKDPEEYLQLLTEEIQHRAKRVPYKKVDTVYFGGGTPSLMTPQYLTKVLAQIKASGFKIGPEAEVTMEINPATISPNSVEEFLKAGFNRFSVGAQSFNDTLLKKVGRKHNAQDTKNTLTILQSMSVEYSFDLLFGLPGQTMADLNLDLEIVSGFKPPHLSAYCLTVPEGNPLHQGRPPDEQQAQMFFMIDKALKKIGMKRYEISNWAMPGHESKHNMLYWDDECYWGIGLGAHSYFKDNLWGRRFWNPNTMKVYQDSIAKEKAVSYSLGPFDDHTSEFLIPPIDCFLPSSQKESLEVHESLSDFCHISLRKSTGLLQDQIVRKFGQWAWEAAKSRIISAKHERLVDISNEAIKLNDEGWVLSNLVIKDLFFMKDDPEFKS